MIRDRNIIPNEILNVMKGFNDDKFVTYICKNHMDLFSNEILKSDISELTKYVDTLFSGFLNTNEENIKTRKDSSELNEIFVLIKNESDYLAAIKEVLWKLNNIPSTSKKILMHIAKIIDNDYYSLLSENDYFITNKIFSKASFEGSLILSKIKNKYGKTVYLYKNPTDKRQGFYYKGNLLSLKELSQINNVPIVTIQKRIKKGINIENAIKKKI